MEVVDDLVFLFLDVRRSLSKFVVMMLMILFSCLWKFVEVVDEVCCRCSSKFVDDDVEKMLMILFSCFWMFVEVGDEVCREV